VHAFIALKEKLHLYLEAPFNMENKCNRTKMIVLWTPGRPLGVSGAVERVHQQLHTKNERLTIYESGATTATTAWMRQLPSINETNRTQLVLIGMQNTTFGPCFAATHRILIPVVQGTTLQLPSPQFATENTAPTTHQISTNARPRIQRPVKEFRVEGCNASAAQPKHGGQCVILH
jgi:hypothetical protein